jgi:F-type H+-transporting ATPase subunit delta
MADAEPRPTPFDPSAERIARVYAQAILDAADAAGCRGNVIDELGSFVRDVLSGVPGASVVFASPRVTVEQKEAVINKVVGGRLLPTTVHALCVLARHSRLGIVAEVTAAARTLDDEHAGRRQATFTTATPLADADRVRLVEEVSGAVGASLSPSFVVDPDIIGGLVVRIGDTVYDQSIASGLSRLASNLHRRTIHEIQYGRDRLTSA